MIDENRITNNLEKYSFPRLSGTEHESKAFDMLKKEISELGLSFSEQKFQFSTFYSRVYPKAAFFLVSLLLVLFFMEIEGVFALIIISSALFGLIFMLFLTRHPENIKFGNILESQNLIVKIGAQPILSKQEFQIDKDYKAKIFAFMAHVDSKGQRLPIRIRGRSNLMWFLTLISSIIIIVFNSIIEDSIFLIIIGWISISFNIIATSFIIVNFTNNNSPGAIDNASGLVSVLEILHHFDDLKEKFDDFEFWFVFTGAEECGTMGVRHFHEQIKGIDKTKIIIHNFESLTHNVYAFISDDLINNKDPYYKIFNENAKKNLSSYNEVPGKYTIAFHTDGVFLMHKGFNVFEFESSDTGYYMHTKNDTPDKISPENLENLCEVITLSIDKFSKNSRS